MGVGVTETKNLRLARPYLSVEEYLAAEAWTIDAKGMVLVEQPKLPSGTIVRFEVVLASGEKPIRAEGRVIGFVKPTAERPGGVRVRFSRLGAQCKAFLDRVLATRGNVGGATVEGRLSLTGDEPPVSLPPMSLSKPPAESSSPPPSRAERIAGPVEAPANREELLERLRERARRQRAGGG